VPVPRRRRAQNLARHQKVPRRRMPVHGRRRPGDAGTASTASEAAGRTMMCAAASDALAGIVSDVSCVAFPGYQMEVCVIRGARGDAARPGPWASRWWPLHDPTGLDLDWFLSRVVVVTAWATFPDGGHDPTGQVSFVGEEWRMHARWLMDMNASTGKKKK
jgi:hypothetical protein